MSAVMRHVSVIIYNYIIIHVYNYIFVYIESVWYQSTLLTRWTSMNVCCFSRR